MNGVCCAFPFIRVGVSNFNLTTTEEKTKSKNQSVLLFAADDSRIQLVCPRCRYVFEILKMFSCNTYRWWCAPDSDALNIQMVHELMTMPEINNGKKNENENEGKMNIAMSLRQQKFHFPSFYLCQIMWWCVTSFVTIMKNDKRSYKRNNNESLIRLRRARILFDRRRAVVVFFFCASEVSIALGADECRKIFRMIQ